jgi:phage-related protein
LRRRAPEPLRGIGSGVAEIKISAPGGDTYRVVYVAKFNEAVYVLDAFQKKSPSGSRLPKNVQNRIQRRYDDLTVARKRQGLQWTFRRAFILTQTHRPP